MANTKIEYMYRDGGNYKIHAEAILEGSLTTEEIEEIFKMTEDAVFKDCHFFYPGNIGLPAPTFESEGYRAYEDDPEWHELLNVTLTANDADTRVTAMEFLDAIRNGAAQTHIE